MRYDNLRKKDKGQYAWFVQDGFINYLLDYQGVKYIYRHSVFEDEEVLRIKRSKLHSILGIVEHDDLFPKEEAPKPSEIDEEFIGLISEDGD